MKDELLDHFTRQFNTLDSLFAVVNEKAWVHKDPHLKGAWQWMTHILELIEYYFGDVKTDEFRFGHRFDLDWEIAETDRVPGMEEMKQYLDDVRRQVLSFLHARTDADFSSRQTLYLWTGTTLLGRMMYVLRHTQQHIGDINRTLGHCGCRAMVWY